MQRRNKFFQFTKVVGAFAITVGAIVAFSHFSQIDSANLTNVSVTLDNPRPSFRGELDENNAEGSSNVSIETTQNNGWPPSTSTNQLQIGDSVLIGDGGTASTYTITDVPTNSTFNIQPALDANDHDDGDAVISTQSAKLTVRFTTANAVNDGSFRILVPATDSANSADGLPDSGYFDMGTTAPTVTCPTGTTVSEYNFQPGTATASAVTITDNDGKQHYYHAFTCKYSGSGAIGTAFDGGSGNPTPIIIDKLINPAPKTGHTEGQADTYRVIVQQLDTNDNVQDQTAVSIGVIEAVRVTASVAPQITFKIEGVAKGTTACGDTTDVNTTALAVPLGELSINEFTTAAQKLTVATNAVDGYVVTGLENDQLGRGTATCTGDGTSDANCIPDAAGDDTPSTYMTHTNADDWSNTATKGFGYTLENGTNDPAGSVAFEYSSTTDDCDGGNDCYRQFADNEAGESPVTLFSSSTVADNENVNVCYKAVISATQPAGEYSNYIIYTATATF